jgi:hypothetical protein
MAASGVVDFSFSFHVIGETFKEDGKRLCETLGLRLDFQCQNFGLEDAESPRITDMFLAIRNMNATDPRDRVYAFYGFDDSLKSEIPVSSGPRIVDCNLIKQLYTATARYLALKKGPE